MKLIIKWVVISLVIGTIFLSTGCGNSQQSYSPSHPTPLFEHKDGELQSHPKEYFVENYFQMILDIGYCLSI